MTTRETKFVLQSRNDIRFRSYQSLAPNLRLLMKLARTTTRPTPTTAA
jgi:hypothetical protein